MRTPGGCITRGLFLLFLITATTFQHDTGVAAHKFWMPDKPPHPRQPRQPELRTAGLSVGFYSQTCPNAERIVHSVVAAEFLRDSNVPAALLRLLFHDCFVRVIASELIRCYSWFAIGNERMNSSVLD